jgi:hypothetical protein
MGLLRSRWATGTAEPKQAAELPSRMQLAPDCLSADSPGMIEENDGH